MPQRTAIFTCELCGCQEILPIIEKERVPTSPSKTPMGISGILVTVSSGCMKVLMDAVDVGFPLLVCMSCRSEINDALTEIYRRKKGYTPRFK